MIRPRLFVRLSICAPIVLALLALCGGHPHADAMTHNPLAVTVRGPRVLVTIVGSGELHPLRELANQLAESLERPVLVDVRMVPTMSESSDAGE